MTTDAPKAPDVGEPMGADKHWRATPGPCLLCGSMLRPWFARNDRHYQRCPECGLLSVPEGLAVDSEGRSIYESQDASVFEADGNEGYYFDHETNLSNSRRKLAFVERHLPRRSRLLDAGANFGHFLKVASAAYSARGSSLARLPSTGAAGTSG